MGVVRGRIDRESVSGAGERLRATLGTLFDPHVLLVAVRDDAARIVDFEYADANEAACRYDGMTYDELTGTRLLDLLPSVRESGLFQRFADVVETGEALVLDDFVYAPEFRADDGPRRYDMRAIAVDDGLVLTWRDVTDRYNRTKALRAVGAGSLWMARAMIGMASVDPQGRVTYANPALEQMLEVDPGELVGRPLADLRDPEHAEAARAGLQQINSGEIDSFRQRARFRTGSGADLWVDLWMTPVRDDDGRVIHVLEQLVDVSAEMRASDALQRSVRRFRLLAENASDVVYQTDVDGRIEWISPSVDEVLGWDPDLLIGTPATALVVPDDLAMVTGTRSSLLRGLREHGVLAQFLTVRGGRRWMSVTAKPIVGSDDEVVGAVVGLRDVTSEQHAYEELAVSQQRFRLAMDVAPQGMALADRHDLIVDMNPAAARLLGGQPEDMIGSPMSEVLVSQVGDCTSDDRHEHVRDTPGGRVWIDHVTSPLRDDDGHLLYVVHQFIDETTDRMWQQELEHRASHDVLTGLANRRSLLTHLDRLLDLRRITGEQHGSVGVLFCDVDNLKRLNDSLGHHVGDAVLSRIADRMARTLRRGDRVGRLGGDEFVVVLDGVESDQELGQVAEKIRSMASRPMELEGHTVHVCVSIGAAVVGNIEDANAALARADGALYRAKRAGRNRVEVASLADPAAT